MFPVAGLHVQMNCNLCNAELFWNSCHGPEGSPPWPFNVFVKAVSFRAQLWISAQSMVLALCWPPTFDDFYSSRCMWATDKVRLKSIRVKAAETCRNEGDRPCNEGKGCQDKRGQTKAKASLCIERRRLFFISFWRSLMWFGSRSGLENATSIIIHVFRLGTWRLHRNQAGEKYAHRAVVWLLEPAISYFAWSGEIIHIILSYIHISDSCITTPCYVRLIVTIMCFDYMRHDPFANNVFHLRRIVGFIDVLCLCPCQWGALFSELSSQCLSRVIHDRRRARGSSPERDGDPWRLGERMLHDLIILADLLHQPPGITQPDLIMKDSQMHCIFHQCSSYFIMYASCCNNAWARMHLFEIAWCEKDKQTSRGLLSSAWPETYWHLNFGLLQVPRATTFVQKPHEKMGRCRIGVCSKRSRHR